MDSSDWSQVRLTAKQRLVTLAQTDLINFVQSLPKLENADSGEIAQLLASTYAHYQDSEVRKVVRSVLRSLLVAEAEHAESVVAAIADRAAKLCQAPTSAVHEYMVVLEWVNVAIGYHPEVQEKLLGSSIESQSLLLYRVLSESHKRARLSEAALRTTRVSIARACKRQPDIISKYFDILAVKSHPHAVAHLTLLGCVAGAAVDLIESEPSAAKTVETRRSEFIDIYVTAVLGTKTNFEDAVLDSFVPVFSDFAVQDDIDKVVLPAVFRSMLRAPETVLKTIVPSLFASLPPLIDLTKGIDEKFSSFTSAYSSSKAEIRDAALKTSLVALDHCYSDCSSIANKLYTGVKKLSNPDQKCIYGQVLAALKPSDKLAQEIPAGILPTAVKETNEAALTQFTRALFKHLFYGVQQELTADKAVIDGINKALSDKKGNIRSVWISSFAKQVLETPKASKFAADFQPLLKHTFDEVIANVPSAVQQKLAIGAFAYIALFPDDPEVRKVLSTQLITSRVYPKLAGEELYWAVKASAALAPFVGTEDYAWGTAWLYYCLNRAVPVEVRMLAINALRDSYAAATDKVGAVVIQSITRILSQTASEEELAAVPAVSGLSHILVFLFSQYKQLLNAEIVERDLADAAIICHHPSVRPAGGWIGLIQKAGADPGALIEKHVDRILENIVASRATFDAAQFANVACATAATVSFINPTLAAPKIASIISDLLNLEPANKISEFDIKVWDTPEGEIALEDDTSKRKYVENKNTKDYETQKWEESIRKKQAEAKPKKLTKEEQATLVAQSETRHRVQMVANELDAGLALVNALSKGAQIVDNGSGIWFHTCADLVGAVLEHPRAKELSGAAATETFIQLANNLSPRLGAMRKFIAICILRSIYKVKLDEYLTEEPLKELADRVLYRLKFLGDQRPLDSITLIYIVPLLLQAIKFKGGIGTRKEEELEEQVILALGIIATHGEEFRNENTPRAALLSALIQLMQTNPSKAKPSKEALLSVVQNISYNYNREELNVLLSGFISGDVFVRTAVLEAVDAELQISASQGFLNEIWIARFDDEQVNQELADDIWVENQLSLGDDKQAAVDCILPHLSSPHTSLRRAVGRSLAAIVEQSPEEFHAVYDKLAALYNDRRKPPPPVFDKFGIEIRSKNVDRWEARSGVAFALEHLGPYYDPQTVLKLFEFMINNGGEYAALNDSNLEASHNMQQAGLAVIQQHGLANIEQLIPVFEDYLSRPDKDTIDQVSESTIILYGALAQHLKSDDPRLSTIVDRLLSTLNATKSEDVQYAISKCIAPLVKLFIPKLKSYIETLVQQLLNGESIAKQRGAAYGLAGLIKGAGISALADYDVIRDLTDALEDKKDPKRRQGAQYAFECLSQSLSKFFEPYVIELLPLILSCLGDREQSVREATTYAARMIMKNTTGYGIKKLIPLALENLDNTAWRAKKGSVELLGTMAYLDPQQLSSSLSTIIPEIVGVLNDTHKEVRGAANDSLKRFGDVIRNPEIQALVPRLIRAIGDPTKYTDDALDGLLKTQFVHYIDAPSLALVVHVIHRGLRDRSAATKKKACQIVGNMSILTDSEDLVPYLDQLVEELQVAMVDPVPGTRATASRALGALVEKLGEDQFPHLISDLLAVLRDENRAGDRLGSAQALSEVVFGLGIRKLEELLPVILKNAQSTKPWIREGFMPLMIYLPNCFGASLSPYLSQIIPPILSGLADTVEAVRETALKAGRLLVRNYSTKAVDLLLPELERGLSDVNYRIRLSSVELTGDLLYQVTGISSSGGDEQDASVSGQVNKTLGEVLGFERRSRILAALFVCRSDTSGMVRTASIEVWKSLVANTPRTVKEILPTLTQIIIKRLASSEEEHRSIGAATLGELVRRVGGNALSELLPTLAKGMDSSDSDAKQGICIALMELVNSASEEALDEYKSTIIRIVRVGLADTDPEVREAAAAAFDVLQEAVGDAAVDDILPHLITQLQSPDAATSSNAFAALKEMMATKSDVVFPILIPTLLKPPMDAFKAGALGSLATVSGTALYKRLSSIINALIDSLCVDESQAEVSEALDTVLLSVTHDEGTHILMQHLISLGKNEDSKKRELTFKHMAVFFKESTLNYSMYVQDWVSMLIYALDERDEQIVLGAWQALNALISKTQKNDLLDLVKTARHALSRTGEPGHDLPAFALPKGPSCILPVFLHALMYGSNEEREMSALGLADIVERTSDANLKPYVTQMVGPLIRTIGERFPSDVKSAILYTLNVLLSKIPQFLKPFLPQLQRTFAKSLSDPTNETLRTRAAKALGTLITLQARIDPLVTELISGAKNSTDEGVTAAMHDALAEIVVKAGDNLGPASKSSLIVFVQEQVPKTTDDKKLVILAKCLGGVVAVLDEAETVRIIRNLIHEDTNFSILAINCVLKADKPLPEVCAADIRAYLYQHALSDSSFLSENAVLGLGKLVLSKFNAPVGDDATVLIETLAQAMEKTTSRSPDARRLALIVTRTVARKNYDLVSEHLDTLVLPVFGCVRDTIIPVKLAAEKCYLAVLRLVEEQDTGIATFEAWLDGAQTKQLFSAPQQQRSVNDYTRRVALRLAASVKDRVDAGGDDEQVLSDEMDDEREIWSVGNFE